MIIRHRVGLALFALLFLASSATAQPAARGQSQPEKTEAVLPAALDAKIADAGSSRMIDFVDPTYGGRIRQVYNAAGDEHNLYHYRRVFNSDNSYMLGIETPKETTDYLVTLYDGEGGFLKRLYTQRDYDWTLAWDRRDRRFFIRARTIRFIATTFKPTGQNP